MTHDSLFILSIQKYNVTQVIELFQIAYSYNIQKLCLKYCKYLYKKIQYDDLLNLITLMKLTINTSSRIKCNSIMILVDYEVYLVCISYLQQFRNKLLSIKNISLAISFIYDLSHQILLNH